MKPATIDLTPNATILELDPSLVQVDPELSALRDRTTQPYRDWIGRLAKTIEDEGQFEPAIVRETPDGFVLVAGQCRKEAIELLREDGNPDITLRAVIDTERSQAASVRVTLIENLGRENFSDMELAERVIPFVRKKFNWEERSDTKEVAGYLGVSIATVTELEKLVKLDGERRKMLESGEMSRYAALEWLRTKPEKRGEVITKAKEIAEKEAAAKIDKDEAKDEAKAAEKEAAREGKAESKSKSGKSSAPKPALNATQQAAAQAMAEDRKKSKERREAAKTAAKIEGKHVQAAQKEVEGSVDKPKAPKLSDVDVLFERFAGPAYPPVMVKFAEKFQDWRQGKATEKGLEACWEDIAWKLPDEEQASQLDLASDPRSATHARLTVAKAKKGASKAKATAKKSIVKKTNVKKKAAAPKKAAATTKKKAAPKGEAK